MNTVKSFKKTKIKESEINNKKKLINIKSNIKKNVFYNEINQPCFLQQKFGAQFGAYN